MLVQEQIDYVAGSHKGDGTDNTLKKLIGHDYIKGVRVANNSGSDVILSCSDGKHTFSLKFPPQFVGWDPSKITQIFTTGTSGDTDAAVKINLLLV